MAPIDVGYSLRTRRVGLVVGAAVPVRRRSLRYLLHRATQLRAGRAARSGVSALKRGYARHARH